MPTPALNHAYAPGNGIEVREYYASAALAGLLANPIIASKALARSRGAGDAYMKMFVAVSYLIADYMVAASPLPTATLRAHIEAADMDRNPL